MSAFKGSYEYSVDNKGRINIPAKLRKYVSPEANDTFTVTRGFEKCVYVYPQDEWVKMENAIRQLSPMDAQHRFLKRVMLQHATESQLDAQARITIPKVLLQLAAIDSDVLILGQDEHIEVWNPNEYKKYLESQDKTFEDVAQAVLQRKG